MTIPRLRILVFPAVLLLIASTLVIEFAVAAQYHVRPNGSATGNGSSSNAWDLRTALNHPAAVHPGDTLWLHGGTYNGSYESFLAGTANAPIIVRSYPGEWAIIDNGGTASNAIWVKGAYTWFWGFEVKSSYATPSREEAGINFVASVGSKAINVIVHDEGATGFNPYSAATNTEIYGCLAYYNGREDDPALRNGYGIYGQNTSPSTKQISENFFFNNFGIFQIHMCGSSAGPLDDISFTGNTVFGHTLYNNKNVVALYGNYETGVGKNKNPVWMTNFFYHADLWLGYNGDGAENATVTNNYFYSGSLVENAGNTYAAKTGNVMTTSGNQVYVRPNKYVDQYEPRRANIVVFNGSGASTVSVTLPSGVLNVGDRYQIRDVQNYFGSPVDSGTYSGGAITIRMPGSSAAITAPRSIPVYRPGSSLPAHTSSDFGAFILTATTSATGAPSVSGSLNASPAILPAGGGNVTLSWSSQNATSANINQGIGTVATSGSLTVPVTEAKTFTLTLNGTGGPVTYQASVQVASSTLPAVTLQSPADGTSTSLTSMTLRWSAVTGATSYAVQVARDASFTSLLLNDTSVTSTSRVVSGLGSGEQYYWRVRAKSATVTGPNSNVWHFETNVTKSEARFPIDLQGTPPETGRMTITVNKGADVDSAYIQMWVYDADGTSEGVLHVNEQDSLILFGSIGGSSRDRAVTSMTLRMSSRAWTNGANSLRFEHTATSGFRIDSVAVTFSTGLATNEDVLPHVSSLSQNYPNPFNPVTTIRYTIGVVSSQPSVASDVKLVVYDLLGRQVAVLVNERKEPGSYQVQFDASDLSSGVYLCRIQVRSLDPAGIGTEDFVQTLRLLLVR
jgi:hypothetical protein